MQQWTRWGSRPMVSLLALWMLAVASWQSSQATDTDHVYGLSVNATTGAIEALPHCDSNITLDTSNAVHFPVQDDVPTPISLVKFLASTGGPESLIACSQQARVQGLIFDLNPDLNPHLCFQQTRVDVFGKSAYCPHPQKTPPSVCAAGELCLGRTGLFQCKDDSCPKPADPEPILWVAQSELDVKCQDGVQVYPRAALDGGTFFALSGSVDAVKDCQAHLAQMTCDNGQPCIEMLTETAQAPYHCFVTESFREKLGARQCPHTHGAVCSTGEWCHVALKMEPELCPASLQCPVRATKVVYRLIDRNLIESGSQLPPDCRDGVKLVVTVTLLNEALIAIDGIADAVDSCTQFLQGSNVIESFPDANNCFNDDFEPDHKSPLCPVSWMRDCTRGDYCWTGASETTMCPNTPPGTVSRCPPPPPEPMAIPLAFRLGPQTTLADLPNACSSSQWVISHTLTTVFNELLVVFQGVETRVAACLEAARDIVLRAQDGDSCFGANFEPALGASALCPHPWRTPRCAPGSFCQASDTTADLCPPTLACPSNAIHQDSSRASAAIRLEEKLHYWYRADPKPVPLGWDESWQLAQTIARDNEPTKFADCQLADRGLSTTYPVGPQGETLVSIIPTAGTCDTNWYNWVFTQAKNDFNRGKEPELQFRGSMDWQPYRIQQYNACYTPAFNLTASELSCRSSSTRPNCQIPCADFSFCRSHADCGSQVCDPVERHCRSSTPIASYFIGLLLTVTVTSAGVIVPTSLF